MTRQSPFEEFERFLEQLRMEYGESPFRFPGAEEREPNLDCIEYDDEFVVTIDLPGYDRTDVTATLDDRTLSVRAERSTDTHEEDTEDGHYLRHERRHASAQQEVSFPVDVDADGISATMTNGVLTITVPKATPSEAGRKIEID